MVPPQIHAAGGKALRYEMERLEASYNPSASPDIFFDFRNFDRIMHDCSGPVSKLLRCS
jgi:hypothetical protein